MQSIVVKFGGSSLASAAQFQKVAAIIHGDPARRYVVASAPGKRGDDDTKVTDLLYRCYDCAINHQSCDDTLSQIETRFSAIASELGIAFPIADEIAALRRHLAAAPSRQHMASRGEYLNSKLLAAYLGFPFVDAADVIRFHPDGTLDGETTNSLLTAALADKPYAVVPGFYGAQESGAVCTFSRGGSDVTGAIVARAVMADLYENWTDVSGMLMADPRVVDTPAPITRLSYRELRELSYMGASMLHEDAVFPVRAAGIPINIRNTNRPADPGTMIVSSEETEDARPITGIAGRSGFSSILIEKAMMNAEIGFGSRVLQVLERHGISFEHLPSGIDTLSVVVATESLDACRDAVLADIRQAVAPDSLSVEDGLAMVAVVGHGMVRQKGTAARIFAAIADADVNIRMLDQGSSELNIILGIAASDYRPAIRAIYDAFMR